MKQKKAQVSAFIIIGIAVIAVIGILTYIRVTTVKEEAEVGLREITETVPTEALPVRNFVESTIDKTAREALDKLGRHGGYTQLDPFPSNPLNPTEANNLEHVSGFKMPYWYYLKSSNDCTSCSFDSEMPQLCKQGRNCITDGENSIELQMEKYIDDELEKNLNNFESLTKEGFEIKKQELPKSQVIIRDKDIVIYVDYPLSVKKESEYKISQFQRIIRSDLAEMYETAYDIKNYEAENCLVEEHVKNYLSGFYGLENGQLPPISKTTSGPGKIRIWTLSEVESVLKTKTADAMDVIGIFNTSEFEWPEYSDVNDPYYSNRQAILDQRVFYPLKRAHEKTSVALTYKPWWRPYLNIKPEDNGVIMPTQFSGGGGLASIFASLTSMNTYEFQYQYSFPVAVEIRKTGENDNEQLFRFALEGNIRGNKCLSEGTNIIRMTSIFPSLTCSEAERTKELTVEVKDEAASEPLEGVEVAFETNQQKCSLGYTDSEGRLITKYPDVYGDSAFIVLNKDNYFGKFISQREFSSSLTESMKPIRERKVVFQIIPPAALGEIRAATSRDDALEAKGRNLQPPTSNDTITVSIKRIKESYKDPDFESAINFYEGELYPESIELIPGTYNVSIQMLLNKEIVIPAEYDRVCESKPLRPGACKKTPVSSACPKSESFETTRNPECYKRGYTCEGNTFGKDCQIDEEIVYEKIEDLKVIPNGGVEYNSWRIGSYSELDRGENIIFYLFRQNIPERHVDLSNLMVYKTYSSQYAYAIKPEIK